MKSKANKIKIVIVFIIIILMIIICIYYRRDLLNQNKWEGAKEYLDEYAYQDNKEYKDDNILLSFMDIDDKNIKFNIIKKFKEINDLYIRLDITEDDYKNLILSDKCNIYSIQYQLQDIVRYEEDAKEVEQFLYSDIFRNRNIENMTYVYPNYIQEQIDLRALTRYYLKVISPNNKTIMNLGDILIADQTLDSNYENISYTNYYKNINIEKNKYGKCKFVGFKDLKERLQEKVWNSYFIEYFNNDVNFWSGDFKERKIDYEYGIHINNVQLEYIFLKKSSKIVPILRLNGMMRGLEDGDIKLSFWTWILDE